MEVARAERVRFQKRDVSTEFQSKKLRTWNLRGNSRLQTFSSFLLPTSLLRGWLFIRLTARRYRRGSILRYYIVYKLIKMIIKINYFNTLI